MNKRLTGTECYTFFFKSITEKTRRWMNNYNYLTNFYNFFTYAIASELTFTEMATNNYYLQRPIQASLFLLGFPMRKNQRRLLILREINPLLFSKYFNFFFCSLKKICRYISYAGKSNFLDLIFDAVHFCTPLYTISVTW